MEWAVNSVLMPLADMACFSYLTTVEEVTGLCVWRNDSQKKLLILLSERS